MSSRFESNAGSDGWENVHLFTPEPDDRFNASVNFAGWYDLGGHAEGYAKAAGVIFNHLIQTSEEIDYLAQPFIFLCRHALELRIKEIIRNGYALQAEPKDFKNIHEFSKLWPIARCIIVELEELIADWEIQALDHVINEFAKVDDGSFAFRYPEGKAGRKNLAGFYAINLRVFYQTIDSTLSILQRVAQSFEDRIYEDADLKSTPTTESGP